MKMKGVRLNLDLTGIIAVIAGGVMAPVMLLTAVGIVAVAISKNTGGIVTGILVICFGAAAAGSALIAILLAGRKARLARLQADFIANVSHELRTPLSSIKLYAQTLRSGKLSDDPQRTSDCIAIILREAGRLDMMIDQLLMWRSSSKDLVQLNMEAAPVTDAVSEAVRRFKDIVPPDEVSMTFSPESRLPVRHDRSAVNNIVLNLLVNAYKYTEKNKTISVRTYDDAGSAVIEVKDNGIGIAPADIERIFEPFYRADRHDGSTSGGAGLGLSIVRYLVSRHDGKINVRSEMGKGTVFTVQIPAADKGK